VYLRRGMFPIWSLQSMAFIRQTHSEGDLCAALLRSCMNEAPHDDAERAQPRNAGRGGLNSKAGAVFVGGLRIAGHVEDAACDLDKTQHRGYSIADVDCQKRRE
jgi:hypothetical protein